jgi:hypothetical protein
MGGSAYAHRRDTKGDGGRQYKLAQVSHGFSPLRMRHSPAYPSFEGIL